MKVYANKFDLATPSARQVTTPSYSDFGLAIKVLRNGAEFEAEFTLEKDGETLAPEADKIDGYTVYLLASGGPGAAVYKVRCGDQSFDMVCVSTDESVFEVKPEHVPDEKFGLTLDNFVGDVVDGELQSPVSALVDFESDEITAINSASPYSVLKTRIKSFSLPNLATVGNNGFGMGMGSSTALTSVSLPSLSAVGSEGMYGAFQYCSNLVEITLPGFVELTATSGLQNMFKSCTKLEYLSMPNLSSAGDASTTSVGNGSIASICDGCTSLKVVEMPKLSKMGQGCAMYTFRNCTSLQYVDFREATAIPYDPTGDAKQTMFKTTNSTFKIIVPDTLYDSWISHFWWSSLSSQIVKSSEYPVVMTQYGGQDNMDNI